MLALALMVFWLKHRSVVAAIAQAPLSLVVRIAAGSVNRPGCRLRGAVESETPLVGRQLHVAVAMQFRERVQVLGQSARVVAQLLQAGATGYDRILCDVDHGEEVNSLVSIQPSTLATLLEHGARVNLPHFDGHSKGFMVPGGSPSWEHESSTAKHSRKTQ